MTRYDIVIIGGGILGSSLSYFLSSHTKSSVLLLEQERNVAHHTSTRNTGKVHAPFLYDPTKKKLFAKAAFLGFSMWQEFCRQKSLPFRQDGVLEVATYEKAVDRLHKYVDWGYSNGLGKDEIRFLERPEVTSFEPNVKCLSAIYCSRDGSVNYGAITKELISDAKKFGGDVWTDTKAEKISKNTIYAGSKEIEADFIINCAGGQAIDIAHSMGIAREYTDLHFRGEYWQAPQEYHNLTKMSVYSVPKYPEYPFLDPHWIVRVDGRREIGPNAVPVFGPYAYNFSTNLRNFIPKIFETSRSSARKIIANRQFMALANNELKSSLSKTAMINRAREFLPALDPSLFTLRGTAGIRSSVIDKDGNFVPDTLIIAEDRSLHILNYNSPGATGALPMSAMIVSQLMEKGIVRETEKKQALWDAHTIASQMTPQ